MSEPPSAAIVLVALFFTALVGYTIQVRAYAAAAAVFTYGLALVLGLIYRELKK